MWKKQQLHLKSKTRDTNGDMRSKQLMMAYECNCQAQLRLAIGTEIELEFGLILLSIFDNKLSYILTNPTSPSYNNNNKTQLKA